MYVVMEYVDGLNLDSLLKEQSLTLRQMLEIALKICRALAYAHSKGIVLRDLKPSNILISKETLAIKVADFGLVQLAQATGEPSTLTQSNIAMGTIEYMAPEQRKDARSVDQRADIFSFGIILYEMFTGQLPDSHFKRPSEINPQTPKAVEEIVLRCLKPDPADRFQHAIELAQQLEKLLREDTGLLDTIVRKVKSAKERASTALRMRPQRFVIGASGLLAVVVIFSIVRSCGRKEGLPPSGPGGAPASVSASAYVRPITTYTPVPKPTSTSLPASARKAEGTISPETAAPGEAEGDFKKAESYSAAYIKVKNLRQYAVTSMRAVVEKYKESAPEWAEKAQLQIGQIYEKAGETDLALAEYARLLALFPSGTFRPEAQFRIAECLKPSGFFSGLDFGRKEKCAKAIEEYTKVYKEYPASPLAPKALFAMGLLQEEGNTQDLLESSISSFDTVAREYQASEEAPHALLKVAQLCQNKKVRDYEKAIKTYEEILARYPDHEEEFHVLLNIGGVYETKTRDRDKAIEAYKRVIREKPGTGDALEANRRIEYLLQAAPKSR